ncbi:MAG: glycerate kinase [Clostridia bacterium]|nr:glycerate kinase [Clostridia bacterium]
MKIVVAPDSFKGTVSSLRASELISESFARVFPSADIVSLPIADGGEGTVEAIALATGSPLLTVDTVDGYGRAIKAVWCAVGGRGVCQASSVVTFSSDGSGNVETCSSYGLGAIVRRIISAGCKSICMGLGGTASNDGGTGLASALGVKFYRADGSVFVPCGATLHLIADYDDSEAKNLLDGIDLVGLCDVDNPFTGELGAARVFSPQKGADPAAVERLERGMLHLQSLILRKSGIDLSVYPGAGAAGGLGGGICALLGGRLAPGAATVIELSGAQGHLSEADLLVTGEGRVDAQTLMGKTASGLIKASNGCPTVIIGGFALPEAELLYAHGAAAVCACNRTKADFKDILASAEDNLRNEAYAAARLISVGMNLKEKEVPKK